MSDTSITHTSLAPPGGRTIQPTQLKVVHTTGYQYDDTVLASFNEARLTPRSAPDQLVVHSRVEISPTAWTQEYADYWGSVVTAFELTEPHRSLTVTGTSTVQVNRPHATPAGLSWEELTSSDMQDRFCEFLEVSGTVEPGPDLAQRVQDLRASTTTPSELARAVCDLVHAEVEYATGATEVTTTARDAWEFRNGVCQDMAHLVIGALRLHGVPVRYVSGYLHPDSEPQVGVTVPGESHAWVEWWDGEWIAFDPTNDEPVANRHVVLARGREYADVAPLSGIYAGGAESAMFVDVQITRVH